MTLLAARLAPWLMLYGSNFDCPCCFCTATGPAIIAVASLVVSMGPGSLDTISLTLVGGPLLQLALVCKRCLAHVLGMMMETSRSHDCSDNNAASLMIGRCCHA